MKTSDYDLIKSDIKRQLEPYGFIIPELCGYNDTNRYCTVATRSTSSVDKFILYLNDHPYISEQCYVMPYWYPVGLIEQTKVLLHYSDSVPYLSFQINAIVPTKMLINNMKYLIIRYNTIKDSINMSISRMIKTITLTDSIIKSDLLPLWNIWSDSICGNTLLEL